MAGYTACPPRPNSALRSKRKRAPARGPMAPKSALLDLYWPLRHAAAMKKASKPVAIFDLLEFDLESMSQEFGILLFCHLMIERALEELLWHAGIQKGEDWQSELSKKSFYRKVGACQHRTIRVSGKEQKIISDELADALLYLNELRNRSAHHYNEPLSFKEVHFFVGMLAQAKIDFTDDIAASPRQAVELGYSGIFSLFHESTKHLFFELGFLLEEAGGPNLVS